MELRYIFVRRADSVFCPCLPYSARWLYSTSSLWVALRTGLFTKPLGDIVYHNSLIIVFFVTCMRYQYFGVGIVYAQQRWYMYNILFVNLIINFGFKTPIFFIFWNRMQRYNNLSFWGKNTLSDILRCISIRPMAKGSLFAVFFLHRCSKPASRQVHFSITRMSKAANANEIII